MAKAYLVIRIKGQADVPYWANTTLNLLELEKKYRAVKLPVKEKPSTTSPLAEIIKPFAAASPPEAPEAHPSCANWKPYIS